MCDFIRIWRALNKKQLPKYFRLKATPGSHFITSFRGLFFYHVSCDKFSNSEEWIFICFWSMQGWKLNLFQGAHCSTVIQIKLKSSVLLPHTLLLHLDETFSEWQRHHCLSVLALIWEKRHKKIPLRHPSPRNTKTFDLKRPCTTHTICSLRHYNLSSPSGLPK